MATIKIDPEDMRLGVVIGGWDYKAPIGGNSVLREATYQLRLKAGKLQQYWVVVGGNGAGEWCDVEEVPADAPDEV